MSYGQFPDVSYRSGCNSDAVYFGECYQHHQGSGATITGVYNVTRVPDYSADPSPSGIEPYASPTSFGLPDCAGVPDCGSGNPACNGLPPTGALTCNTVDHNYYVSGTGLIDFNTCRKIGFKNVQARKVWHGRFGFLSHDPAGCSDTWTPGVYSDCPAENFQPNPDTTKYLRMRRDIKVDITCVDFYCQTHTATYHYIREYTVDRYAGTLSLTECYESPVYSGATCDAIGSCGDWMPPYTWAQDLLFVDACAGNVIGTSGNIISTLGNPVAYVTNTGISIESHGGCVVPDSRTEWCPDCCPEMSGSYDISCNITLSDPYTAQDLYNDTKELLAEWDMTDDMRYPWRTDEYCTIAPLVTRNEVAVPVSPDFRGSCTMDDGNGGQIPWTDFQATIHDGSIRGAPLPAGYQHHFDWQHRTWKSCNSMFGGTSYYVDTIGAWSARNEAGDVTDTVVPVTSTQWTENYEAGFYAPGAWQDFRGGVLTVQKWAEVQITRPSINFARPCGADRYNFDEPTVRCISAVTTGTPPNITIDTYNLGSAGISTDDPVLVCGTNNSGVDGAWKVTRIDDDNFQLSTRLFALPSGFVSPHDCEAGILGKLRFPSAPGICGKVKIVDATNTAPIALTLSENTWLTDGDRVKIENVLGNTAANGIWRVKVKSPSEILLSGSIGNAPYSGKGVIYDPFGAGEEWNDSNPKGEFSYLAWTFNFRDGAEYDRMVAQNGTLSTSYCDTLPLPDPVRPWSNYPQEYTSITCETHCLPHTTCCPTVLAISPNGESWANGKTFEVPVLAPDERYGSYWQAAIRQHIPDPLWQAPHKPCVLGADGHYQDLVWNEDNGACSADTSILAGDGETVIPVKYYPLRPYVESRCELPSGAPLLPHDAYINCVPLSGNISGLSCQAQGIVGHAGGSANPNTCTTPWGIYLRELSCVCGNVRSDFIDDYQRNGIACAQEVPPP